MKLTDYVIEFLVEQNIEHVFGLTGGAVVHLFDSVHKNKKIQPVFQHHEQAAALAAVAYARIRNGLGAVIVTTGPGGTNAITGVLSAWQDSIPCIFISGQSRTAHTSRNKPLRQVGVQELDIVSVVDSITKYAVMVEDASHIRYELEKAIYLAKEGRPGPVWLDIPLDLQWTEIEPEMLQGYIPEMKEEPASLQQSVEESAKHCLDLIANAERPLILAGYGIRLAHAEEEFSRLVKELRIPFVCSWTASDLVDSKQNNYIGRPGIFGQRGANLAVQNSDLLIVIGSHLSIPLTGAQFGGFAREAKIFMVNIDPEVLQHETVKVEYLVHGDAKLFMQEMLAQIGQNPVKQFDRWIEKCKHYKIYNEVPDEWQQQKRYVNPYVFLDKLSEMLNNDDMIVIDGGGTNLFSSFQGFKVKLGQRLTLSSGICAMGTGLPESVGVCFAHHKKRTICLSGDGSMQLNIQELQTIYHHNLPVKIFVMNNQGYLAIRHTQSQFLNGNYVGSENRGDLSLPDYLKIANAYGIKGVRVYNHGELEEKIDWALSEPGPVLCEILVSPEQQLICQQGFYKKADGTATARPLEDMLPYLDREEFLENMIVEPYDKSVMIGEELDGK